MRIALSLQVLVCQRHLELAVQNVQPSVSPRDQRTYEALRRRLGAARGRIEAPVEREAAKREAREGSESRMDTEEGPS